MINNTQMFMIKKNPCIIGKKKNDNYEEMLTYDIE